MLETNPFKTKQASPPMAYQFNYHQDNWLMDGKTSQ